MTLTAGKGHLPDILADSNFGWRNTRPGWTFPFVSLDHRVSGRERSGRNSKAEDVGGL